MQDAARERMLKEFSRLGWNTVAWNPIRSFTHKPMSWLDHPEDLGDSGGFNDLEAENRFDLIASYQWLL